MTFKVCYQTRNHLVTKASSRPVLVALQLYHRTPGDTPSPRDAASGEELVYVYLVYEVSMIHILEMCQYTYHGYFVYLIYEVSMIRIPGIVSIRKYP